MMRKHHAYRILGCFPVLHDLVPVLLDLIPVLCGLLFDFVLVLLKPIYDLTEPDILPRLLSLLIPFLHPLFTVIDFWNTSSTGRAGIIQIRSPIFRDRNGVCTQRKVLFGYFKRMVVLPELMSTAILLGGFVNQLAVESVAESPSSDVGCGR